VKLVSHVELLSSSCWLVWTSEATHARVLITYSVSGRWWETLKTWRNPIVSPNPQNLKEQCAYVPEFKVGFLPCASPDLQNLNDSNFSQKRCKSPYCPCHSILHRPQYIPSEMAVRWQDWNHGLPLSFILANFGEARQVKYVQKCIKSPQKAC
jgi:hypothetical protein